MPLNRTQALNSLDFIITMEDWAGAGVLLINVQLEGREHNTI